MSSRTLVGGTAYKTITKGKTLVRGTNYTIGNGKTRINGTSKDIQLCAYKPGQIVEWTKAGTYSWECKSSGYWEVEIHGGGGGGSAYIGNSTMTYDGGGGAGSGIYTASVYIAAGTYVVYVGKGGTAGTSSRVATMGENSYIIDKKYVDAGGSSGMPWTTYCPGCDPGGSNGGDNGGKTHITCNIATDGDKGYGGNYQTGESNSGKCTSAGGLGHKDKPTQTYGNGGNGGRSISLSSPVSATAGSAGAIIMTFIRPD